MTVKGNRLFLTVFEWPESGQLYLPGLQTDIESARLLNGETQVELSYQRQRGWTVFELPARAPEELASVIEVKLARAPEVDSTFAVDPNIGVEVLAEFSQVEGAKIFRDRWMEKFGEWVLVNPAGKWQIDGQAVWEIEVLVPGDYAVALTYAGEGRLVWRVGVEGGEQIQNQQNASHNYQEFPIGWLNFPKPGRYKVAVSCIDGKYETAKLKGIRLEPLR